MVRTLTGKSLTVQDVVAIGQGGNIALSSAALSRAKRSKRFLDSVVGSRVMYGVTTGFGPMASRLVGQGDVATLQRNLIVSHACGAGEPLPDEYVLGSMAVRLNTLLRGDSGVSIELLERIARLINARFAPIVPEHGGVGASGDLTQLAHIALGIIGEGDVRLKGERMSAKDALAKLKLGPHVLQAKEGLALINGTSCMAAIGAYTLIKAQYLFSAEVKASTLALEASKAFSDSLSPFLHVTRPHPGQGAVAAAMRALLRGSKLLSSRKEFEHSKAPGKHTVLMRRSAQDVYSIRCSPQILGPILETLRHVEKTLTIELNSATDNPIIDARNKEALHGGNFHGEYVAAAMDTLKRSIIKLSMLSERRLNYFLHDTLSGYAPFLNMGTPGLTLGLQGLQFTATSTVAHNQSLGYPHSLHSIPSNADNQDIVSMGADAALIAKRVIDNSSIVVAIELAALSQAMALQKGEQRASAQAKKLLKRIRSNFPLVLRDRSLEQDIRTLASAVSRGEFGILSFD